MIFMNVFQFVVLFFSGDLLESHEKLLNKMNKMLAETKAAQVDTKSPEERSEFVDARIALAGESLKKGMDCNPNAKSVSESLGDLRVCQDFFDIFGIWEFLHG